MKPIYELVTQAELNVGDTIRCLVENGNVLIKTDVELERYKRFPKAERLRLLPATDSPAVLRQIIDLMMKHMDGCDILNVSFDDWKTEAIRTLESEKTPCERS